MLGALLSCHFVQVLLGVRSGQAGREPEASIVHAALRSVPDAGGWGERSWFRPALGRCGGGEHESEEHGARGAEDARLPFRPLKRACRAYCHPQSPRPGEAMQMTCAFF